MKVVLFCGGLGMRIRAYDQPVPKPMFTVGDRPVLWHMMRYYAAHGHTEFVLCLGFGATTIKDYFLDYRETHTNDFVLRRGGAEVELLGTDIADWTITFVDTGLDVPIGERLRRVREHLDGDEYFFANYGDVLSDAPLDQMVDQVRDAGAVGTLLAVCPPDSFHTVAIDADDRVEGVRSATDLDLRVNGGYFVLSQGIFDYLDAGEDLVGDALPRAAADGRFLAWKHKGFWAPMDTLKERATLEAMHHSGEAPWEVWRRTGEGRR
ncbi:glucose-1-phosphate cytidylyltransferase [Isoptericola sp. NEAU-Y5]|uniref:Glucose-1-phosphate cytidylyltransferase n=1 Tax=Isoptericola luteus TaxID=2879484 RepID=A0ABS7ZGB4_9MICO|nr:sugar phosphate nucleotidyltransferase [Isoptericola sp. NEAU-Y5]MCA5892894.1 glucose-1-phosphate cytidylyltransferase [Isoptericola sp. NEAU-Y5]